MRMAAYCLRELAGGEGGGEGGGGVEGEGVGEGEGEGLEGLGSLVTYPITYPSYLPHTHHRPLLNDLNFTTHTTHTKPNQFPHHPTPL